MEGLYFKKEWYDAIQDMDVDVQLEIYTAAMTYFFSVVKQTDETKKTNWFIEKPTGFKKTNWFLSLKKDAKIALNFILPEIYLQVENENKRIEKLRINGSKGGRPKGQTKPTGSNKTNWFSKQPNDTQKTNWFPQKTQKNQLVFNSEIPKNQGFTGDSNDTQKTNWFPPKTQKNQAFSGFFEPSPPNDIILTPHSDNTDCSYNNIINYNNNNNRDIFIREVIENKELGVQGEEKKEEEKPKKISPAKKNNSTAFDFAGALISNYGASPDYVRDWLIVRKTKKAANTETALKLFTGEVKKSGLPVNDVLQLCIERNWQGFKAEWAANMQRDQAMNMQRAKAVKTISEQEKKELDELKRQLAYDERQMVNPFDSGIPLCEDPNDRSRTALYFRTKERIKKNRAKIEEIENRFKLSVA
jgi:hypothetical protein